MATATQSSTKRLVDRITDIRTEMKAELVERGVEIDLLIAAVIARVHVILLGEPGVAKSMLVDQFFAHVEGIGLYKGLMNKNTVPEEVFGPPSMTGLEHDEFYFVTDGMLPEAHLAFVDEVFKSNSTILNGMLSIVNERRFRNGTRGWIDDPLWTAVGASNELPTHDREDLVAFRDRFGITKVVQPVRSQDGILAVIEGQLTRHRGEEVSEKHTTIARDDVELLQAAAANVIVPQKVERALADLRMRAENQGLNLSLRRIFEGLKMCQANALLSERNEVRAEDLRVFEHVLWNDPEEISTAAELTIDFAGAVGRKAAQLRTEFEEIQQRFADAQRQMPAGDEAPPENVLDEFTKVSALFTRLNRRVDEAIQEAEDNAWDPSELESVHAEVKRSRESVRSLIGIGD